MIRFAVPFVVLMSLAACDAPQPPQDAAPAPGGGSALETPITPVETPAPIVPEAAPPGSCRDEIGQEAAQVLADRCRQVSPATRPPCNVANPCAMIQAEIDRACALWDGDGDAPEECAA